MKAGRYAISRQALRQGLKFFSVSLAGGSIDAGVGLTCFNLFGFSLYASTVAGFCAGLIFGYVAHQNWTFASGKAFDVTVFVKFVLTNLFLLVIRLGTVHVLLLMLLYASLAGNRLLENGIYLIMLGISFTFNYLFCRFFVFNKS